MRKAGSSRVPSCGDLESQRHRSCLCVTPRSLSDLPGATRVSTTVSLRREAADQPPPGPSTAPPANRAPGCDSETVPHGNRFAESKCGRTPASGERLGLWNSGKPDRPAQQVCPSNTCPRGTGACRPPAGCGLANGTGGRGGHERQHPRTKPSQADSGSPAAQDAARGFPGRRAAFAGGKDRRVAPPRDSPARLPASPSLSQEPSPRPLLFLKPQKPTCPAGRV